MTLVPILGVPVRAQTYEAAITALLEATRDNVPRRAHFATVHSVVEAANSTALQQAFGSAWMVCSDGMPLAWVARLRGAPAERVCGPDVMLSLCDRGRAVGLRHYFLGGAPGTAERLASRLAARLPGLQVVGTSAPSIRDPLADDQSIVDTVNAAAPDVLWVGLGSPKQDLWAATHEDRLRCGLILPVGAAFDFHSGNLRRAPLWMQRYGLEWLFRLASEPRRLVRRYLVTNTRFFVLLVREEVAERRGRHGADGK